MVVFPAANSHSRFSDAIDYVFHTQSRAAYGKPPGASLDIVCRFDRGDEFVCRAGHDRHRGEAGRIMSVLRNAGQKSTMRDKTLAASGWLAEHLPPEAWRYP